MKSFVKKILLIIGLSLSCMFVFGQTNIIGVNAYFKNLNSYKNGDTLRINKTYSLSPVKIYNRLSLKNYVLPLNKGSLNQVLKLGAGDSLIWVDGTNLGNWSLTGNAGTDTINNFIGSTDNSPIIFKINNHKSGYIGLTDHNTYFGAKSGSKVYDGEDNTYIGYMTGYINYGNRNTFIGSHSAFVTSIGNNNIFLGYFAGHNTDSLDNRLIIGSLIKNNSHEDTTLSIIYGKQDQLTTNQNLYFNSNVHIKEVPVGTSDSVLVRENTQIKYKLLDMTQYLKFSDITQITDVTYAQLQTLITNATLETGRQYRITDYATAYNIFDGGTTAVIEAQLGTAEPLIVLATGEATLAKEAYSELYPQDIIYYNPLVNAVDRAAFIVAGDIGYVTTGSLVAGFKGIIEYRHDTKQNVSTWYDFRNIKFRRWAVDCAVYDAGTAYTAKDVLKGSDGKIYKCISDVIAGQGDPSTNTVNWILWNDITADAYISWTADNSMFAIGNITPTNLIFDTATYQDVYTFGDWYRHVNSVTIGKNELAKLLIKGVYTTLNNIVFKTQDNAYTCFSNEIGQISYNNTIGYSFINNAIGSNFNYNAIGSNFNYNTIGSNFNSNTIGNGFYSNTIGNEFNANTIDNRFSFNTIGNQFYSNTIGNEFNANTIDNRFSFNTIGNNFYFNTIGNNFSFNTIGNNFSFNTIGNGFSFNTIGNGFYSNTIGNNSKVSAGINCQGNSIGDYNTQVTLGDNCTNLTFQNGCTFNTNTAVTGLQNCLFESGTFITGVDFTSSTHIKATYNKRVFTNASSVVRLSYFNAADTLTVVNVND